MWTRRAPQVAAGVIVAIATVGFFMGTKQAPDQLSALATALPTAGHGRGGAQPARSQSELTTRPWSTEQADWPGLSANINKPITPRDDIAYRAAMADRKTNRAYEGAPPTIPHPVGAHAENGVACQACHLSGGKLGTVHVPPMGHRMLTNCTQCHVPQQSTVPARDPKIAAAQPSYRSTFIGAYEAPAAYRWSYKSPPQIPHPVAMRGQCLTCHGQNGRTGLQTSHPERHNCVQCHAAAAQLDKQPGALTVNKQQP